MIWIWIFAAWILSYAALGKEKIRFEHLFWLLLPVDMYGISVAGFTVKPYMLFCAILLLRLLNRKPAKLVIRSRWSLTAGYLLLLVLMVNLINTSSFGPAMAAAMAVIVWGCCMVYLSECGPDSAEDICRALIASAVGYGAVFLIAYATILIGIDIPGAYAEDRMGTGIFLRMGNMYMEQYVETIRLRGFTIDPNGMIATFLYGTLAALLQLAKGRGGKRDILAVILSAICILMSNSRMGLLCFVVILVAGVVIGYRLSNKRGKNALKCILLMTLFLLPLVMITTDLLSTMIGWLISQYANRSGLADEYGRFSIWRESISIFWENNILLGIGLGEIQYYTSTGRGCHNTWLEWLLSSGIVIGGLVVVHFALMMVNGIRAAIRRNGTEIDTFVWTMVLGTLGVVLALCSVDNVTYSYLWAGAMVVAAITRGYWKVS